MVKTMTKSLQIIEEKSLIDELPLQVVIEKLQKLFIHCVGKNNAINLFDIFEHVFGSIKCNKYQFVYLVNHKIQPAINYLKRKTNFFIIGEIVDEQYMWYVLKNKDELDTYQKQVERKISGLRSMQIKAMKHVMEQKWKELI